MEFSLDYPRAWFPEGLLLIDELTWEIMPLVLLLDFKLFADSVPDEALDLYLGDIVFR